MRYDLNLMRAFVALMEEGSVTRAALRLGLSQPALSATLGKLRGLFNDPLFIRERYGLLPTSRAAALLPDIQEALRLLDRTVDQQQRFDPAVSQHHFVIATNSYVEFTLLPGLVQQIAAAAPMITLRVIPYNSDLPETGIMSGETALVIGRVSDPPETLVIQTILEDGLACVVRADHPQVGPVMDRATYERLRHVNLLPPGRLRAGLFQALEANGLRREVAVSVTHFLSVPELIAATDYCTTLPRRICTRLARDPRLRVLAPPADLGRFPVHMAWHPRYRSDPAHQWLRQCVQRQAEALDG
jgi:DNA-binding transcriptional LysR family regulator